MTQENSQIQSTPSTECITSTESENFNIPPTNHVKVLGNGWIGLIDVMGNEAKIVNAARVSFGKMRTEMDKSDVKLLKYLIKNRHSSPLEHMQFTFSVKCPLFVRAQWHRHRTWCLSGDTNITFNRPDKWREGKHTPQCRDTGEPFTIEYLYEKWNKNEHSRNVIKNMLIRVYDEKKAKFSVSHVCDVIYNGKKEVFEIETKSGKKLKCTKDHKLLTTNGWETLEDAIGLEVCKNTALMSKKSFILTNGTEKLWTSYDWMKTQREDGLSVSEMAGQSNCSYHCIRKWLKIHDLKFDQKQFLTGTNGLPPWNKNKHGYHTSLVVSDFHKEKIRKTRSGVKSNLWKGGITRERINIGRWTSEQGKFVHKKYNYTCQICGERPSKGNSFKLQVHHANSVVEFPDQSYDIDNLITVCKRCHKLVHSDYCYQLNRYGTPLSTKSDEIIKVQLVGTEDVYDLSIEGENHNFIANGMVVHNCFNEISRRYTEENLEFFVPETLREQAKDNRQASINSDKIDQESNLELIRGVNKASLIAYEELLKNGVCREQARGVLPQNMMTTFWATVDLHNLIGFLLLRDDSHAQEEIRVYAKAIKELIRPIVPHVMEVLDTGKFYGK